MSTPNKNAGQRILCLRCAKACIVAPNHEESARLGRTSDGAGTCAECLVTGFIKAMVGQGSNVDPHRAVCFPKFTPEWLRLSRIQDQVIAVIKAGIPDMAGLQLDFDEIIANWDLPLVQARAGLAKRQDFGSLFL